MTHKSKRELRSLCSPLRSMFGTSALRHIRYISLFLSAPVCRASLGGASLIPGHGHFGSTSPVPTNSFFKSSSRALFSSSSPAESEDSTDLGSKHRNVLDSKVDDSTPESFVGHKEIGSKHIVDIECLQQSPTERRSRSGFAFVLRARPRPTRQAAPKLSRCVELH